MAATDLERLVVQVSADLKRFENEAKKMNNIANKQFGDVQKRADSAGAAVGSAFTRGGKAAADGTRQASAAATNLTFQLNDIATSLAGGASPFQVMAQQGSQVAQALGSAGGGLGGALKAIGGAVAGLANPVSLASFAFVGLTGVLVQYLTTLKQETPDINKLLQAHADVIKSFDDAYGIAEEGAKRYNAQAQKVATQKLKDEFGSLSDAAKVAADSIKDDLLSVPIGEFRGLTKTIDDLRKALGLLDKEVPDFQGFAVALQEIENNSKLPENIRELAKNLRISATEAIPLQEALTKTDERLAVIRLTSDEAKAAFVALTGAATGMGDAGGSAFLSVADSIRNNLLPALQTALEKTGEFAKNLGGLQTQINQSPLGTLSPLVSGGGQFLDPAQQQQFNFDQNVYREAGESAAAQMIRGFESFISTAKWDVNAFRTGYGSDTATRANGVIEQVTKDTVVSLDDAERDLSRRIIEFQSGIQQAIGVDTWRALNEAQKAALTSIAYNYGSLPKSIVDAINGGGGPEIVAQAIAGLTSNKGRRQQEAQAYLSGSVGSSASTKQTPSQIFSEDLAQTQKRIDLLNAEFAARSQLNPTVDDYGYAIERAKIEQELLSDAQKAGLEITPQLRESIGQLAENYARASANSEQLRASQQSLTAASEDFRNTSKDLVSGFISDLRSGKSAAEALQGALDKVLDKVIDIALNAAFGIGGGGGGGGFLGGLFSLFGFAKGGYTGNGGKYEPAGIVHKGEYVFDKATTQKLGPKNLAKLAGYANGGMVGSAPSMPQMSPRRQSEVVTYSPSYTIDARGADQAAVARLERGLAERDRTESKRVSGYSQRQQVRKTRP